MANYNEIKGQKVQYLTSDPTLTSANEGQVWYNSTSGTLKGLVALEAWSSGSPLNTAIYYNAGAGTQTSALSFAGVAGGNPTTTTQTEEYNGSGWSIGGALPVAKRAGMGAGTQTAALHGGGATLPGAASTTSEEYDGTKLDFRWIIIYRKKIYCWNGNTNSSVMYYWSKPWWN